MIKILIVKLPEEVTCKGNFFHLIGKFKVGKEIKNN